MITRTYVIQQGVWPFLDGGGWRSYDAE